MKSALAVHTPLPVSADVTYRKECEEHLSSCQQSSYGSITLGILYLLAKRRPDILYSVAV